MSSKKEKKFILDIDAILDFIISPDEKKGTDISLEEVFIPNQEEDTSSPVLSQRIKREEKKGEHPQHEIIRFELFKMLYEQVSQFDFNDDSIVFDDFNFGDEIAYNTLINYGLIKIIS